MRTVEERNIAMCIILSLVTCGIYGLYWFVCLTEDTNAAANEEGTSGVMALVFTLITCGIYGLYWAYKCGEKLDKAKTDRGMSASNGGVLYLILYIFGGIIAYALIQNELNKLA
jgi:amino acid transporter